VGAEIGPIAKPKRIVVVTRFPRTRSGKVVRRLLGDLAAGRPPGDDSTLADVGVLRDISRSMRRA
jgi:acetyl-CoA synthetase